ALPGVEAAGHAVMRVLEGGAWRNILRVEGYTPPQGEFQNMGIGGTVVYVRTAQDPSAFYGTVRSTIENMDAALPVVGMRTLRDQVDRSLMTERMIATLAAEFGSLATLLAMIGLYGVMSFTVARRAREIGIRLSLGAQAKNVLGMMMREVAILMLSGILIAVPAYIGLARYIRSQLFGIEAGDPINLAIAALFLLAVGLLAGYIPSRRALRVDPVRSLRYE